MKVLLISVLMEKNAIITEEIGICSIAAYVESKGYEAQVMNTSRVYLDYEKIFDYEPDVIGFPVYSTTEDVVYEVCEEIKKRMPHVVIVYGGYWPTCEYEYLLKKYPLVDYITLGEGEVVTYNLVDALAKGNEIQTIPGIVYREGDQIIANPREKLIEDLDQLPFPKRDLLKNSTLKYAYISTSRGCVANCSFCWHQKFWETLPCNRWRGRTPENIVAEIRQIVENYGVNRFWFIDDSFEDCNSKCPDRMMDIVRKIIDEDLFISYETYMRSDVHRKLDSNRLKMLKESGFVGVIFGTESGNSEDLALYNKIATVEDNLRAIQVFRENDIAVDIGFINFNPYSTFERLHKNVDFLEETCFASVLYYLVERCGVTNLSDIYQRIKEDGLLIEQPHSLCHSYHYVYKEIGCLSEFLYSKYHANDNSKEYFFSKKIGSYIREELKLLNHVKRQFGDRINVVNAIRESESSAWSVLKEVNESNAKCFRELLYMTEAKWSEREAEKISEKYLNLGYLKKKSGEIEKIRLSLYLRLKKLGVDPQEFFNLL